MRQGTDGTPGWLGTICLSAVLVVALTGKAFAASTADFGDCHPTGPTAVAKLRTIVPGTLSVRGFLPAPGFWNGDSFATIKSGFEYCLAAYIAYRAGLHHLRLVKESYAAVVGGLTNRFDIAISEIPITAAGKKVVDFTVPYYNDHRHIAVMTRAGIQVNSQSVRDLRIATERGTTEVAFVQDEIRPTKPIKVFTSPASMYESLASGQVDAIVYDTNDLLSAAASSDGRFAVAGVYPVKRDIAGIVGKQSPNLAAFDTIITGLRRDGTLERLFAKYLVPAWGGVQPLQLPLFKLQDGR